MASYMPLRGFQTTVPHGCADPSPIYATTATAAIKKILIMFPSPLVRTVPILVVALRRRQQMARGGVVWLVRRHHRCLKGWGERKYRRPAVEDRLPAIRRVTLDRDVDAQHLGA